MAFYRVATNKDVVVGPFPWWVLVSAFEDTMFAYGGLHARHVLTGPISDHLT